MVELVVASGKGGTGKTSLTGLLAELAGSAVLVDCDVDAADLHLIVSHRVLEEHKFSAGRRASIDMNRCISCDLCLNACRFDAISTDDNTENPGKIRYSIDPLACEGCGLCYRLCPEMAIIFDKVISGRWFLSESDYGPFLHARLGIAQSNSGLLVSLLRQHSRDIAQAEGESLILIDGPPGIGCPVIASITGATYLLIVTEPSLSALHDLERLVRLADHFGIGTGLCLNKFDINEEIAKKVERFAAERGLPIHGKIPYDPAFIAAQVNGESYLKIGSPDGIRGIREVWQSLSREIGSRNDAHERHFAV